MPVMLPLKAQGPGGDMRRAVLNGSRQNTDTLRMLQGREAVMIVLTMVTYEAIGASGETGPALVSPF